VLPRCYRYGRVFVGVFPRSNSDEMTEDSPQNAADSLPDPTTVERFEPETRRSRSARLLTLDHLDGRTLAVRRVRELEGALIADLGGDPSAAQRALVRRASVLSAVLEDREARWASGEGLDLEGYNAGTNALRRLLATLGLERRARPTEDWREWIDRRAREAREARGEPST